MKTIPKKHLTEVCKIGQLEKTCKFIIVTPMLPAGPACAKFTEFEDTLANRRGMTAQSDNCRGLCLVCGEEADEDCKMGMCEKCIKEHEKKR